MSCDASGVLRKDGLASSFDGVVVVDAGVTLVLEVSWLPVLPGDGMGMTSSGLLIMVARDVSSITSP